MQVYTGLAQMATRIAFIVMCTICCLQSHATHDIMRITPVCCSNSKANRSMQTPLPE